MNTKKRQNTLIFAIILIISFVVVLGYYYSNTQETQQNKTIPNKKPNNNSTFNTTDNSETKNKSITTNYVGTLYYLQTNGDYSEIYSQKNNEEKKLIFTDKDESKKIKSVQSMTNDGKILVFMSSDKQMFDGSLHLVDTDGSGNISEIIENFASPQVPIISPSGSQIAYILFSNAEANFGFSLYTMSTEGQNKTKINNDKTIISNPAWNPDSEKVIYQKGNQIVLTDTQTGNHNVLYSLRENDSLLGLNWNCKNNILITLNNSNTNNSKIISINLENSQTETIYESQESLEDKAVWGSLDGDKFFYITKENQNLNISDLNNNRKKISKGTNLIQWLK